MPRSKVDGARSRLDALRSKLDLYDARAIRRARRRLETRPPPDGQRCFHKLKQIDERFSVCGAARVFLDVCGGPGQFVRYLSTINYNSNGYGATLRGPLDYSDAIVGGSRAFTRIYGFRGTGDVMGADVIDEIACRCKNFCDFVCADGGFDVKGRENRQESLTLPLIRKECEIILMCLREGGNCVLKVFDTFEPETVELLENFVRHFHEHYVFKPPASRSSNSERYVVCKRRLASRLGNNIKVDLQTLSFANKQISSLKKLIKILDKDCA